MIIIIIIIIAKVKCVNLYCEVQAVNVLLILHCTPKKYSYSYVLAYLMS